MKVDGGRVGDQGEGPSGCPHNTEPALAEKWPPGQVNKYLCRPLGAPCVSDKPRGRLGSSGGKLRGSTFLDFKGFSGGITWAMSSFKTKQQKAQLLISYVPERFSLSLTHAVTIAFTTSHMLHWVLTHLILQVLSFHHFTAEQTEAGRDEVT